MIQVLQMCNAFSKLGLNVTLAVPEERYGLNSIKKVITHKINKEITFSVETYRKITANGKLAMLGGYIGIRKILRKLNTDYCFVRNPVFINATIRNDIPTIFESHNSLLHEKYRFLDLFWRRNLISNSRSDNLIKFITISNALAEMWKSRGVPEEKVTVLHDGVDSDSYSSTYDQYKLREEFKLPLHKKIVSYAGSLYANRGIENILKLARLFPQVLFLVLGGPEQGKNYYIKSSVNQNIKNITFVGYIPHHKVKDYLFAADVLLMIWTKQVKTIDYCSPLKMFEYMAAGRIIVGHAFPTIREVLTDGQSAYLADPTSFDDLKRKMALALEQSYPNLMAHSARTLALEQYSWKARAQAILNNIGSAL